MVKLSQATVNWNSQDIGFGFLNSEDMISQVKIYVMGIAWILCGVCVEVMVL